MKKTICIVIACILICSLSVPAFAVETETVFVPAQEAVFDLFPAIFESIISIFQAPPITYLLGVLLLAFIVLAFKTITHY